MKKNYDITTSGSTAVTTTPLTLQAPAAAPGNHSSVDTTPLTPATAVPVVTSVGTVAAENEGQIVGYVRVSTREQNEARQVVALREFGIPSDCIFVDKQSGKDFERPAYKRLLSSITPGDTLVVKSIDRLGRNYEEILEQWRVITKEKHCAIVVLDMPLLDTRNSRDLTGTLIADIVLQLLSYVAETERNFIKQRQAEGIAAAKARGQRFGRPAFDRGPLYPVLLEQWREGLISIKAASRQLGVSPQTFANWVHGEDESK